MLLNDDEFIFNNCSSRYSKCEGNSSGRGRDREDYIWLCLKLGKRYDVLSFQCGYLMLSFEISV